MKIDHSDKKSFCKKTMRYSMKKKKRNKTQAHKMMADIAMSGERKYQHLVQEPAS